MYVNSIKLINFRNYSGIKIFLNEKVNIFLGENGQGKTNLLESIYIASTGKSFRSNKDKELITIEKEAGYIGVELIKENVEKYIELKLDLNNPKRVKINGVEQEKISDLTGVLQVVVFSPEDLKIIKEGPSHRRNFLDDEITQMKPVYKSIVNDYNRVLTQRNNLLKVIQYDSNKKKMLSIWNEQLVELGTKIMILRKSFVDRLAPISKDIHHSITDGGENLEVQYSSSFNLVNLDKNKIINKYNELLSKYEKEDIEKGTTKIGPHRDDLDIIIDDKNTRIFGSQGQQRTAALSLRLAEVKLIKEETEEYPVLLLDDVFSELDINRRKYLISTFKDVQTIITSTDDIEIEEIDKFEKRIYYIKGGNILYSK
ncbi:DNA replication/repair protein RecF [Clostridium sp. D2Q-11]|uniref:DNA replication and repair protein RecF n=1 Tax=Anaeromonas frigoriresistens TaxID=2683708 RepID=A0A942Z818_9FIRM|nr:DNA replication/repair protein RecF [Anaeromonas frigoriresistens]MBS4539317.1 DNA replication/repair protein RecF [Anaeromonas frigoriresistens]